MTLQLFVTTVTLTDALKPIAQGIGSYNVIWLSVKARTNGFYIASNINAIDGFRVPVGGSLDMPISDMVGKLGMFDLKNLYWGNTVSGDNAVIEIIGMRDV